MTGFVLDASAALAWCFGDEATEASWTLIEWLEQETALVPAIWFLEIANGLVVAERRGRLGPSDSSQFVTLLSALPIQPDDAPPERAFGDVLALARSAKLSSTDAAYLDLAMRRGLPLATRDDGLAAAARSSRVPVLAA